MGPSSLFAKKQWSGFPCISKRLPYAVKTARRKPYAHPSGGLEHDVEHQLVEQHEHAQHRRVDGEAVELLVAHQLEHELRRKEAGDRRRYHAEQRGPVILL